MTRLIAALLAVGIAGCGDAVFQCSNSGDCTGGFCEPDGYCSFEDPECPSGRRYGEFAGGGLAGTCTPAGDDGTGTTTQTPTDPSSDPSTSPSTTLSSSGPDPDTTASTSSPPDTTTMSVEDDSTSTSDGTTDGTTSDDPESSSSSGLEGPFTMSFGERDGADVQGVTIDSSIASWDETLNNGAHGDVHISTSEVGLLRIDVSALPAGAVVSGVDLYVTNMEATADGEIEMYLVTEGWIEGTADQAPGVCNWIERDIGVSWTSPGVGDGSTTGEVLDTFAPDTANAEYVLSIPGDVVEDWRDNPGDNHGLAFRSWDLSTLVWFVSRENGDVSSQRPLLVVTYYE